MSWLQTLSDVYDHLIESIAEKQGSVEGLTYPAVIKQNAQLEITISEEAKLLRASRVSKGDALTMVPVTERSSIRTSGPVPHPLFDNLEYLAGDLCQFMPDKSIQEKRFQPYIRQLSEWKDSISCRYWQIIFDYLSQETLASDLIALGVLTLNEDGFLDPTDKHQSNQQHKFLVRIAIEENGELKRLWEDSKFMQDYSNQFLMGILDCEPKLCYVTGKHQYLSELHGKNIRYQGDGAKLISANDKVNYTFRGKFNQSSEAVGIGYVMSEKAHSALRWLIRRQAFSRNGYVVVAFGLEDDVVQPFDDTEASFNIFGDAPKYQPDKMLVGKDFSHALKQAIYGRIPHLDPEEKVTVLAMDNATPGRLSLQFYREFSPKDYIENILHYHQTMKWSHRYKVDEKRRLYTSVGVPRALDLITYVFGTERDGFMTLGTNDKYLNQLMQRLLPCIIERARIPSDFVDRSIAAAVTPLSKSYFNWQRSVSICCGIVNKYSQERKGVKYSMALDKTLQDRGYLFGRLLAVAEKIERDVYQSESGASDRQTNAMRYMNVLSKKPYRTWMLIEQKIQPYLRRLPRSKNYYQHILGEIMDLFSLDDYTSNKSLDGTFVLGFHCQLQDFYKAKEVLEEKPQDLLDD